MKPSSRLLILAVMAGYGCTHTDPASITDRREELPFRLEPPIRLTWSELTETEPAFSPDGKSIAYIFERDGDRDRCIGVLPLAGGTRSRTICAWELDEASARDGMSAPGLSSDGRIIFTRQFGRMFVMPNDSSALYIAGSTPSDDPARIASLPINLPGSARSWPDLMSPVWISENEVLALTAQRFPYWGINCIEDCPDDLLRVPLIDTLRLGIEIARIRFDNGAPTLLSTFPAIHASDWAYDASTQTIYLLQRTVDPEDVTFLESTSDTVYRVPLGGGSREVVFGIDRMDDPVFTRIHGIAAGNGRLFASISSPARYDTLAVKLPPGTGLVSNIFEINSDGSRRSLTAALDRIWGLMALSPDGRTLVAELMNEDRSSDLYMLRTDQ
ncbi:MAG TPA: hypothetical protein PLL69_01400 [Gemmatimonadales bacterium]|nr:hypothetical protein [Gemmatimonadales bacterium]